jgi:two-component system sensor histidine kinase KdpD
MPSIESKWRVEAPKTRGYLAAAVLVGVAIAVGGVLRRLPHANLSLLFLLVALVVAAVWGLWPSIFATLLSFLSLNYFFTVPLYSFTVEEEGDLASIVFFLAMAALTANLAARMRSEMAESRSALERVSTLLDFSGKMSSAVNIEGALATLTSTIARTLGREVAVWLPDRKGGVALAAQTDGAAAVLDLSAIGECAARGEDETQAGPLAGLLRLELASSPSGLVAVSGGPLGAPARKFAEGRCEQAGLAVERILLVDDLKAVQLAAQTDQLRAALLSSVSHDLRTPLASIIGSVSSILEYRDKFKPGDQSELLQTVLDESQRLNRYIQNLLDMTRLGHEQIELRREWVDLNDLVSAAISRFGRVAQHFDFDVHIDADIALIQVQGALIEQALVNVLDNAIDFSQPGARISVSAYFDNDATVIDINDEGPGIPEAERDKVFEMFYMAEQPDGRHHGVGLGLAICRSIAEAHDGNIDALAGASGRGTCMRIRLPVDQNPIGRGDA